MHRNWCRDTQLQTNGTTGLFFLCIGGLQNQLSAYCNLLYWTVYICNPARAQNDITNAKADKANERGGGRKTALFN